MGKGTTMGQGGITRWAGAALAALLLLALAATAGAAKRGTVPNQPKTELKTTGNDSELIESVPISTKPNQAERVAMSLGPEELPRLRAGDRIRVGGEVQVSTTCVLQGPRCIGRRYEINPFITARIVLAGSADPAASSIPLSEAKQVKCTQRRPQRNHHCTIALPMVEGAVGAESTLPCADSAQCFVNLLVGAWHRKAKPGNRVVLGADEPDGGVKGDKGRLNVVHTPGGVPGATELFRNDLVNTSLPLNEGKKVRRRVVHSIEIAAPRKNEVLAVDASYQATIDPIPYNTVIVTKVIVADTPTSVDSSGLAETVTQFRGDLTEGNGFNCTQGASGFRTPCTVQKAGAIRINDDAIDPATGQFRSLFVNLVGFAKPLLYPMQNVKKWHQVVLSPVGGLRVFRYTPPS
jgi:hypothetical protein